MVERKEYCSKNKEHESVLQDQNHCCLCGAKLSFKHKVDYLTLQVCEEADCPDCKIRMKTREHVLQ